MTEADSIAFQEEHTISVEDQVTSVSVSMASDDSSTKDEATVGCNESSSEGEARVDEAP